jgi:glycine dehydrogenase subunit 1
MFMRYLALTEKDRKEMRSKIGIESIDELYDDFPIPDFGDLPGGIMGELELERKMLSLAQKNFSANMFFLGAGCYWHHVPATVDYVIQRSEFLTCYTPYQPELSQGTLMAMFEFQTMICALTGMDVANASMYDGPTALAEAALMAMRLTKRKNVYVSEGLNPEYLRVLSTYIGEDRIKTNSVDADAACFIVQVPDFFGQIRKISALRERCIKLDVLLVVVVTEIVSLGLLPPPSAADIVVGEGQSIGMPMSFGGPHLGFFACRQKYIRQMPGRLCGQTVDQAGRRAFTLTLNTREQHIRRERATSNICTNQGLTALAFTVHMSLLGEIGFKTLARINHEKACILADMLSKIRGVKLINDNFFNEFVIELPVAAQTVVDKMAKKGIVAGITVGENNLLLAATEMNTEEDIKTFVQEISAAL